MSKIDDGMSLNDSIHTDEDEDLSNMNFTKDSSLMMKTGPGTLVIESVGSTEK